MSPEVLLAGLELTTSIVLGLLLVLAAYTDLRWGKVYDWCTLPALALGLILSLLAGGRGGGPGWESALLGLAVGGGVFGLAYLAGGLGGGDVKLAAAIGAIKGFPFILSALFYAALVGAVLALITLIARGRLASGLHGAGRWLFSWRARAGAAPAAGEPTPPDTIPYGVAIAAGTIYALVISLG